jgi:hypothetical protein
MSRNPVAVLTVAALIALPATGQTTLAHGLVPELSSRICLPNRRLRQILAVALAACRTYNKKSSYNSIGETNDEFAHSCQFDVKTTCTDRHVTFNRP